MRSLIKFFSSLKLTVWLLTASMLLVFFGTLDQVHFGIWQTQKLYFESFFVIWSYPEQWGFYEQLFWLRLPLPGGYLLGGLLLINLVAAHLTRFQLSFKKCGLFLIHFGLILLIVSELLTDLLAHESQMAVSEGQRSNYSENFRDNELVLINRQADTQDTVHAISS
jgi:cytochrome c biogenesis factor